jgi:hypothetical protein
MFGLLLKEQTPTCSWYYAVNEDGSIDAMVISQWTPEGPIVRLESLTRKAAVNPLMYEVSSEGILYRKKLYMTQKEQDIDAYQQAVREYTLYADDEGYSNVVRLHASVPDQILPPVPSILNQNRDEDPTMGEIIWTMFHPEENLIV